MGFSIRRCVLWEYHGRGMKRRFLTVLITFQALLGSGHASSSADSHRAAPPPQTDPRVPAFLRERWGGSRGHSAPRPHSRAFAPGDERWWDGFKLPVTDGSVNAAINYQGSLVIAGRFTRIGDVKVNNIARWDGSQWFPLGSGTNRNNNNSRKLFLSGLRIKFIPFLYFNGVCTLINPGDPPGSSFAVGFVPNKYSSMFKRPSLS